ncbi:hypothetical protein L873DRAFT_1773052 [Choiromyces venosus 120613-1]|uniref:Uncharacterized protein n=1 Tax=Choiromyces venosus 120613-1 TaxID=1336337 RepID=A0A3N4JIX7_9PEZI|nr:hypothetical protein L873DRAFT_1773052 [Choiromyces venosus 120613-1]
MGAAKKALIAFIEDIPDAKLAGFPMSRGLIWYNNCFRLDMQGLTSGVPKKYNLQIQANRGSGVTTVEKLAPDTVAGPVLIGVEDEVTPQEVRDMFLQKLLI